MALQIQMADGSEPPCHRCGKEFRAGDMKVGRPREGAGGRDGLSWVHAKAPCDPRKSDKHSANENHKKRRATRRAKHMPRAA